MTGPNCRVDGCEEPVYSKKNGLCHRHWWADRNGRPLEPLSPVSKTCTFEGCESPAHSRNLCVGHYLQQRRGVKLTPKRQRARRTIVGRKYVLLDDFDGSELPDGTAPVNLSLGRTTYSLYLSEDNYGKLLEALEPFIKDAETASTASSRSSSSTASSADKEKMKKVREWAQATKYTYKNAKGEEVTLGDRGRIPQEVVDAYDAAN